MSSLKRRWPRSRRASPSHPTPSPTRSAASDAGPPEDARARPRERRRRLRSRPWAPSSASTSTGAPTTSGAIDAPRQGCSACTGAARVGRARRGGDGRRWPGTGYRTSGCSRTSSWNFEHSCARPGRDRGSGRVNTRRGNPPTPPSADATRTSHTLSPRRSAGTYAWRTSRRCTRWCAPTRLRWRRCAPGSTTAPVSSEPRRT